MERGGRERRKGRVGETTCLTPPHWLLPQIPPWFRTPVVNILDFLTAIIMHNKYENLIGPSDFNL